LFWHINQHGEASHFLQRAVALQEKFVVEHPEVWRFRAELASSLHHLGLVFYSTEQDQAAERAYLQALAHRRKLASDFSSIPDYQSRLGDTLQNLAMVLRERKELTTARGHLKEAICRQGAALAVNPRNPTYRENLCNHYSVLADTLIDLGEHAEAAKAAAEPPRIRPDSLPDYRDSSGQLAHCVSLALKDARLSPSKRQELANDYAGQAVQLLQKAIKIGYKDLNSLKTDPNLDVLRSREDFKQVLHELAQKLGPGPK
jgi:tetratricopeptide (TPR) repeat protein